MPRHFPPALLLALCLVVACGEPDVPPVPPPPPDPDEAPADARIEGLWVTGDSILLGFNDDGTLLLGGTDPLIGRNWDRFGDSLTLYYHRGVAGEILESRVAIAALTADALTLVPAAPPFGGRYQRRVP